MEKNAFHSLLIKLRKSFLNIKPQPFDYRIKQIQNLVLFLKENETEIEKAIDADLKKPATETFAGEIALTLAEARYTLRRLSNWVKPKRVRSVFGLIPSKTYVYHEPLGVVLIIAPWNYPIQLALVPLIGAIAAGNCVVVKPSELAPATSQLLAEKLPQYLEPDTVSVVTGGVEETTQLLKHKFDHILFTGSKRVAKIILDAAAQHLTPVTLELGGKSPCVVNEDADLKVTARRILWGKFTNVGQVCLAPDYLLVHEKIKTKLIAELKQTLIEFYGDDPQRNKDFGRVVNREHLNRLLSYLNQGEIIIGGNSNEGELYLAPTLITNVSEDAPIMNEEIFGPILPIISVPNMQSAIQFINQRPKPLALYFFTEDKRLAREMIARTSSGSVVINHTTINIVVPALPFGGVGDSGMGAYHGRYSFETFSHRKSVVFKPTWGDIPLLYPPYSERKKKWISWIL